MRDGHNMIRLILIIGCFLIAIGCYVSTPAQLVLFDFESDEELDRMHWKCHTLFQISDKHVTHGTRSLRLDLYPSEYPGLSPILQEKDWHGYQTLCFDFFNPNKREIKIIVRIDDQKDTPEYNDRYNRSYMLRPGMNHMEISIDTLITSGTQRKLNLKSIYRFLIFLVNPSQKVILYMDYIRLVA